MKRACHPLQTVKSLAKADQFVVGAGRATTFFDDAATARAAIRQAIATLTALNFAHTAQLPSGLFDVYGLRHDEGGWYLKLALLQIQGHRLFIVSFHPLKFPLQTCGGMVHP